MKILVIYIYLPYKTQIQFDIDLLYKLHIIFSIRGFIRFIKGFIKGLLSKDINFCQSLYTNDISYSVL